MRVWRIRILSMTALTLASAVTAAAQQDNLSLASALKARATVEAAINAMGGLAALRATTDVTRELDGIRTDVGQGPRPVKLEPWYGGIGTVPPATNPIKLLSIRDYKNQRTFDYNRYVIYGGQPVEVRTVIAPSGGFSAYYDYIDHGLRPVPAAAIPGRRTGAMRRYPEGLMLAAWNALGSVRYHGEATFDGRPQRVVSYADADGALVTLYFDAQTALPTKVESVFDSSILGDGLVEVVFADYRPVGNLTLPWRIVDRVGGYVLQDLKATAVTLNTAPADSLFTRPQGFTEVDSPSPTPVVEKLAEDVFAILGADYNSIAVGFQDFILVLEAGASTPYAEAAMAKIKEAIPNKPIRYLVTTHWNWDHLSGIRPYIAEGATIVATPMAKAVIERAAASRHQMRPDGLSRNPKAPIIEVMSGSKRVFTDGVHTVEIHDISPSPHVDEMLIAWLPRERIVYEGDLLDINVPGKLGTGGDDTADFAKKIERMGWDVQRIVPTHGHIGTPDDLRQALARKSSATR